MFNGRIFKQMVGVPIGNSMAGMLADILLRNVEEQVLYKFQPSMVLYLRYIDDILVIWKDGHDAEELEAALTLKHYGLKLKREQRSKSSIHFLDLQIDVQNSSIRTSVYRKLTYTGWL